MKQFFRIALSVIILISFTGCSLFVKQKQLLAVDTSPKDCDVIINGDTYRSPVRIMIPRSSLYSVTVVKDGYEAQSRSLERSMSKVGIVDVIGCCIWGIPGLGLLADGAWEINNANMFFTLKKVEE